MLAHTETVCMIFVQNVGKIYRTRGLSPHEIIRGMSTLCRDGVRRVPLYILGQISRPPNHLEALLPRKLKLKPLDLSDYGILCDTLFLFL